MAEKESEKMENKENPTEKEGLPEKLKSVVENKLKQLLETDIQASNVDYFGKLVDIHKDIENENYWKVKKEVMLMRYNDYGGYSGGGYSDGGYSEGGYSDGSYGRRGVPGSGRGRGRGRSRGRYREGGYSGPEEMMERMQEHYGAYSESSEAFGRGNYGAKEDTLKSLDYMLKSVCQFMEMLEEDASSEEEVQLIKKYAKKIGEM